jgi:hypothetical protein
MLVAARRAPWQNPRILSTLVLVFLAGGASGALWMQLDLHKRLHGVAAASREPKGDSASKINLQRLQSALSLSTDQSEKIALVLDDFGLYYQSLQEQADDLRATGKTRILQILNPNQRDKFEKFMNDLAPQLENTK